ncbi:MAG: STAS domain-containing protein [Acidobacteria bacterium]|nr:STAS domain-containing protein [Acidobacteriota bacterium]
MALEIARREREGIAIIDVKGKLVVGETAGQLRETFKAFVDEGLRQAIVNLEQVEYIDSTGLGTLVICFTTMKKAGGTLKLQRLSRRNVELLLLTKLTTIFEIFDDEQDAVNSFFPDREIRKFDVLSFVKSNRPAT